MESLKGPPMEEADSGMFLESPLLRMSQLPGIGLEALVVAAARRKDSAGFMGLCRSLASSKGPAAAAAALQEAHALHWAAFLGSDLLLTYLLQELGCSPTHQEEASLETPIYFAIKAGNFEAVRCLLAHGGCTLLQHQNRHNMTPFLVAAGEFAEEKIGDALRILELIYLHGVSLEEQDDTGQTALMWAARRGSLPILQWLLSKGANLNHRDCSGSTALHACVSGCGAEDCMLLLSTFIGLFAMTVFLSTSSSTTTSSSSNSSSNSSNWGLHAAAAIGMWGATQVLWFITFKADPGIVPASLNRIKSQFASVHPRFTREVLNGLRWPLGPSYGPYHSQLEQLDRQKLLTNLELYELNALGSVCMEDSSSAAATEDSSRISAAAATLDQLRESAWQLQQAVAAERQHRLNEVYIHSIMNGSSAELKQICVTCNIIKPNRVHHCAECAHCLLRQDHHCMWVDNCIAAGNTRPFVCFLFCISLSIIESFSLTWLYAAEAITSPSQWLWLLICLCLAISNFAWLLFAVYLLLRTTRTILSNVTYFEFLKKPPHIVERFGGKTSGWLWELGGLSLPAIFRNVIWFWQNSPN
ncbi:DHHC zinc finger domain-containing protein, putative [Eimeria maxima]|uniref:Palmitoyltransferase n=1 Tax=Eimeria maxima TaxID=5804 RepID=U6MA12_EIMMA|nr:DHHC zinc finger domain-containing protein, putative [Eimeria maxima]CDJ58500.1 DHHC zinc finger domain-containing protein, putative [Eimeria maxima]